MQWHSPPIQEIPARSTRHRWMIWTMYTLSSACGGAAGFLSSRLLPATLRIATCSAPLSRTRHCNNRGTHSDDERHKKRQDLPEGQERIETPQNDQAWHQSEPAECEGLGPRRGFVLGRRTDVFLLYPDASLKMGLGCSSTSWLFGPRRAFVGPGSWLPLQRSLALMGHASW